MPDQNHVRRNSRTQSVKKNGRGRRSNRGRQRSRMAGGAPQRTAIHPHQPLKLETVREELSGRIIDLMAPLGKGARSLIVAPPRAGKTVLLQKISAAVSANHPEVEQVVLLVDERPEEATTMQRSLQADVRAGTFDLPPGEHVQLARRTIDRCVERAAQGADVLLLVDSLTRLTRAANKVLPAGGRLMTGGLDVRACDFPRSLFAAARAHEEGGSLTIVATALIETGSSMDNVIFEEFKGTGNMELVLDRQLAEARIYPALNLNASGTREEHRLRSAQVHQAAGLLRRTLSRMSPCDALAQLSRQLLKFENNAGFLKMIDPAAGNA